MFSIEEVMFSAGTLFPLALLVFSLIVGIVVSKLSEMERQYQMGQQQMKAARLRGGLFSVMLGAMMCLAPAD
jgi:hypothetical protein